MTLGRLKWLAIVAPIGFLAAMWGLLHSVFLPLHHFPAVLVVLGLTIAGTSLFAFGVFALVNRLERQILAQNQALEQRTQELEAVLTVGRAASSSLELGELLDAAMSSAWPWPACPMTRSVRRLASDSYSTSISRVLGPPEQRLVTVATQ